MTAFLTNTVSSDSVSNEDIRSISSTATKIALNNFEWRFVTLVFFNSTLWWGVEEFLRSYEKSVIVGTGLFYPKFVRMTRQYVLFGTTLANIVPTLNWMRDHEFDNTGKYIIVCESDECDETEAMSILWNYKITNVIFLKSSQNTVNGYTYNPLNDSRCSNSGPIKLDLNSCIDYADMRCDNVFSGKMAKLHGCELIASTFIQTPYMSLTDGKPSGADGDLLCLIAEGLNASLKMMTPRNGAGWGRLEGNLTWTGSLADIYHDYANFSMTSAALTLARFSHFQMSADYNTARVGWVTHPAKPMPPSLKLIHPFQQSAQIAILLCFFFIILCSFIVRSNWWFRVCRNINVNRPKSSVAFYSWMILMGLPSTRLPSKTALLYVVLLWMWFGVLLRTFYQVSLISVLKANYYYGEFETIEEVIEAGCPFGGGIALMDYYIDQPLVYDNWEDVIAPDVVPTLRRVSQGMEFVLAMNLETAKTIVKREKIPLHILSQKIVTTPTVIFFKKFSPLAESVNRVLVRLVESGFADKFYKNYAIEIHKINDEDTLEPIKLVHYTGCYMILLSGWLVSFLLFLAELVIKILSTTTIII